MFQSNIQRINDLAAIYPERIHELEEIFSQPTIVYIDYANIKPWASKLGWNIDIKRVKHLLDSFSSVVAVKLYVGTLVGDQTSEQLIKDAANRWHYDVKTKPVKIMKLSIDASSIPLDSTIILKNFIRGSLLEKLKVETIEYLNRQLIDLNNQGIRYIEDKKCNFDVEIGRDMLLDYENNSISNFVLWSGDSDFADPLRQLLEDDKRVYLFATTRRIAVELDDLRPSGLVIFDIQKIKNFICWPKQIDTVFLSKPRNAKRTSCEALKL